MLSRYRESASETKDQSFVQYEMDLGHITWEEAINHPQRNVLMQCVARLGEVLMPDFCTGPAGTDARIFTLQRWIPPCYLSSGNLRQAESECVHK